jgi:hypothetical protein
MLGTPASPIYVPVYAPFPVTILDEEFSCDDSHPDILELAILRNYASIQ